MAKCPVCSSENLQKVSTLRNFSSWGKRFTNLFDIPELFLDSAKGLATGLRHTFGDESVFIGFPAQCQSCDAYSVVCEECGNATRTTYPAGGTSKNCGSCGKTLYIPDI